MLLNFHEGDHLRYAYCPSMHWICYVSGNVSLVRVTPSREPPSVPAVSALTISLRCSSGVVAGHRPSEGYHRSH